MARPIKETPVLIGKNARNFEKEVKRDEHRKVSQEKYKRAIDVYNNVKIIAK